MVVRADAAALRRLRRRIGLEDDDEDQYYQEVLGSGQSDEEEGAAEHPEFTALRHSKRSDPLVAATQQDIDSLIEWGLGYENQPDARLQALIAFLDAVCRPDGRTWTNERVVVFTEYAETLDWIVRVLGQHGYRKASGSRSSRARRPPRNGRTSARSSPRHRTSSRSGSWSPPTPPARASTCRPTATGWSTSTSRSTRPGWSSGSAASTATASEHTPEIYQLAPAERDIRATRRTRRSCWTRSREKIGQVAADLGSVNEVIDADIQEHFTPGGTGRKVKLAARDDGSVIINRVLAGGQELNRTLTELSRTYDDRKAEMHLTPANARRVVDTALELTASRR